MGFAITGRHGWSSWLRDWFRRDMQRPIEQRLGGPARTRVVMLLACVLALDAADMATVGAIAGPLEHALDIGNTQIGILVAVSTGIGALATLPVGLLIDRVVRIRVLWLSIVLWAVAMLAAGASMSYQVLLLTRLALGAVVATAGPAVASLVGDFFPAAERGVIYGYILLGELVGAGMGYLVAGTIAAPLTWRASFVVLAIPAVLLAWQVRRLPEPSRGGASRMPVGTEQVPTSDSGEQAGAGDGIANSKDVEREIRHEHVAAHPGLVLREDPARRSLWWAVRYVLSVRTNLFLIGASALGYFYFTGVRTFAVVYFRDRFGLPQPAASAMLIVVGLGALLGVLASGRVADRLIRRGYLPARVVVGGVAFLVAATFLLPGLVVGSLGAAIALFFLGAAGIGGANPPLDAARLDIMHPRLWGRAESVRTVLRRGFEAIAPLLFGYVSALFGGAGAALGEPGTGASRASAHGLEYTFLVMLVTVCGAAGLLIWGRLTYPRDVATAIASAEATASTGGPWRSAR